MSGVLKDARVVMGTWVPLRVGCSRVVCPRVRAGVEMHVARGDGFFIYHNRIRTDASDPGVRFR